MSNVRGVDKVLANLNKQVKKIEGRTMAGLIEGARIIREDMDRTPPLIPVGKTENLRAGWFANPIYLGTQPIVHLGFSAEYAWYVHEMIDKGGKNINWNRPDSGPKFLEASLKRNTKKVLRAIQQEAKIK